MEGVHLKHVESFMRLLNYTIHKKVLDLTLRSWFNSELKSLNTIKWS